MGTTELIVEPGRQDVVVVHDFEAPPEVAFRAYGILALPTLVLIDPAGCSGQWRLHVTHAAALIIP